MECKRSNRSDASHARHMAVFLMKTRVACMTSEPSHAWFSSRSACGQLGHSPHQCVKAVGRPAGGKTRHAEVAHFIFKRDEWRIDVFDPSLLVQHGDRFGAQPLSSGCADGTQGNGTVHLLK